MDLVLFLSGASVTGIIAFLISKRSSKNLSHAIQNEARVNTSNTEDQLESLMDAFDLLPIGVVIVDAKLIESCEIGWPQP